MIYKTKQHSLMMMSLAVLALSACGAKNKEVVGHKLTTNIEGLQRVTSVEPTLLFVRPNAKTLGAYNSFIIDPIRVSYRDPKMNDISPEDLNRMRSKFRERITTELKDGGYRITRTPSPTTMRISFTLSGLKASDKGGAANVGVMAAGAVTGLPMLFAVSVGEVTVEATFLESMTNRIDAVAIAHSKGSRVLNSKPWSTWADVESAFDLWAEGIRDAIDAQH